MTPIDPRGVSISSGDGAKPHGRDTSPPKEDPSQINAQEKVRELPRNLTAEQIAETLQATAPTLSFAAAYAVAKNMIGVPRPDFSPEKEVAGTEDSSFGPGVDVKA